MTPVLDDGQACDESSDKDALTNLVEAALSGNVSAWNSLYSRYQPLIVQICRRRRVLGSDAEDISQIVWMRLFEHLGSIREPRALPGWIATTTNHEAIRIRQATARTQPADPMSDDRFNHVVHADHSEQLIREEQQQALREALQELPPENRRLLLMLHAESHIPYHEISDRLGMPVGSIGPTRARVLKKLRRAGPIQAIVAA